jgi:hypothetical protein
MFARMARSFDRTAFFRTALAVLFAATSGCTDPNAIGVQEYGTVSGHVVDAATNKPIAGAIVSIGSLLVRYTAPDGSFVIPKVPAGTQLVSVTANGYATGMASVLVAKDQQVDAGPVTVNPLGLPGQVVAPPPLPTAAPTSAPGSPAPSASPTASSSPRS